MYLLFLPGITRGESSTRALVRIQGTFSSTVLWLRCQPISNMCSLWWYLSLSRPAKVLDLTHICSSVPSSSKQKYSPSLPSGHITAFLFLPFWVSWLGSLVLSTGFAPRVPGSKAVVSVSSGTSAGKTGGSGPSVSITSEGGADWLWGRSFSCAWFCAYFPFKWAWLGNCGWQHLLLDFDAWNRRWIEHIRKAQAFHWLWQDYLHLDLFGGIGCCVDTWGGRV